MQIEPITDSEDVLLPAWLRVALAFVGTVFLLIGIVMLAIPVLPQVWAFLLAAVCFSLASEALWERLDGVLGRWPRLQNATRKLRLRSLSILRRR